jgi:hypothetical protein
MRRQAGTDHAFDDLPDLVRLPHATPSPALLQRDCGDYMNSNRSVNER